MDFDGNMKVTGHIFWKLFDGDGNLKEEGETKNVITTVGLNGLASLLNSASAGTSWASHIGFGSGSTAAAAGQTALVTEFAGGGYTRQAVARSNPSGNVIQYVASLTGQTGVTVNEVGLFDAASTGNMRARQVTGAVALSSASDSLQITWQITFS